MSMGSLDAALSGLRIAQMQLSVISDNIANVNTPGYSRKILPQSAVSTDGQASGVRADMIIRNADLALTRDFWTQVSVVQGLGVQVKYLNQIQQFHGNPAAETNIGAELAELSNQFAALADSPEDAHLQGLVLNQATVVASKISDFADLIVDMRNYAQMEMDASVRQINSLLEQIAEVNKQIKASTPAGKTTAALEDIRDSLVTSLSEELEISFFIRGDGVMVIQTKQGVQLADERPETIHFAPQRISTDSAYPDNVAGLYVGGDPATVPHALNITSPALGGRLGALIEVRDVMLPRQQAEIDELAHKTALRLEQQGLRLFTDAQGQVPGNAPPVPNPPGPLTPVEYVGFANQFQVNPAIVADNTLLQRGTAATDRPVESGSNEVVRRVAQFAFGDVHYQQAVGTVDLRADAVGATTLHDWLGISSRSIVTGTANIASYPDLGALMAADSGVFGNPPTLDSFTLTFEDSRLDPGTYQITINLTDAMNNFPASSGDDALDQLVAEINAQIAAAGIPPALAATATRNPYGQLVLQSAANITIGADMPGGMGTGGLAALGLTAGTQKTTDPYIEIRVGNSQTHRITITPDDTETTLMQKLVFNPATGTGIPGLYAEIDPVTGQLTLRPGNDATNGGPVFGGDIHIVGGPFTANGTGGSGVAVGAPLIEALFGTNNPVQDILHSESTPFRTLNLGPGANINTGTMSATSLTDFAQKMISRQTQEIIRVEGRAADENLYKTMLDMQLLNLSGVNIDEELSHLIMIQNAYAAAARLISTIEKMYEELLGIMR